MDPAISAVIVAFNSGPDLARTLPALARELGADDEVIVVDNGSDGSAAPVLAEHFPDARLVEPEENLGFAGGANRGASLARNELLLFLNPDAVPLSGFGEAIRRPAPERPRWDCWMGLVACRIEGELAINSRGNPVHYSGIAWAGGHGLPLGEAGPDREVPTASGACLAVRRPVWERIGGFAPSFFLYHEDVDLCLRIRAAGGGVGLARDAVVEHDYEAAPGPHKWFWLERNRLATVIRNYPAPLLLLLAPALLAAELAILAAAARGGWLRSKLRSWRELARRGPALRRERAALARERRIPTGAFARILTPELDSPLLPAVVRGGLARRVMTAWWRLVLTVLRPGNPAGPARPRR